MCSLPAGLARKVAARYVGQPSSCLPTHSGSTHSRGNALWSEAAVLRACRYRSQIPRDSSMVAPRQWSRMVPGMRLNMSKFSFLLPPGSHCNHGPSAASPKLDQMDPRHLARLMVPQSPRSGVPQKRRLSGTLRICMVNEVAKVIGVVSPKKLNRCSKDDPTVPLQLQRIASHSRPPQHEANARHSKVMASLSGSENREKPANAEFIDDHMAACQSSLSRLFGRCV
ncbi:hypothetical protein B0T21DRAFT_103609 [Apiosordaria backusii]|uniref:Uncharacterized protein n=1 Tax=Apiosordaria backusii TaxID=314023 RepID=A0AA40DLL2_9PEZI|nr:hypothetical protein B0T21DRAFT_103609 [Apiosordaria backusii]